MAAAPAAEAPALAYLVVGLLAMLSWIVARGLIYGWDHTLGWMLGKFADILKFNVGFGITVNLGGPIDSLNLAVKRQLGKWAATSESAMGYFFHGAARLQAWAVSEAEGIASDVYGWAKWLQQVHLPRWAKWAAAVAVPWSLLDRHIRDGITRSLPHVGRILHAAVREANALLHTRVVKALVATGAIAIPVIHILPRLERVERWDGLTKKRLKRLERIFAAAGAAAIIANALGLPNWRCVTRGNLGRASRALCGLPSHLLNDFLGLLTDFLVLENICTVIPWLETGFSDVAAPLVSVLTEAGAGLCAADSSAPAPLAVPQLYTVPVAGFTSASLV